MTIETLGIHNGWQGLIEGDLKLLTEVSVSGITSLGGTILGTSRIDPLKKPGDLEKIRRHNKKTWYRCACGHRWKRDALCSV